MIKGNTSGCIDVFKGLLEFRGKQEDRVSLFYWNFWQLDDVTVVGILLLVRLIFIVERIRRLILCVQDRDFDGCISDVLQPGCLVEIVQQENVVFVLKLILFDQLS